MKQRRKTKTVFVGLSGGVDSSMAAALLKKEGFDVVGIYLKCWSVEESPACTSREDENMARLVASHLGIPFYVWNFIDEYKKRVVEYMIQGYERGVTPNPDMMCNREIKFGLFFDKAMSLGADYVATGHYARTRSASEGFSRENIGFAQLLEGVDKEKDQSYFLAMIDFAKLSRILFPVGKYRKSQVREMAGRLNLPNADRKDSQGICFIGEVNITDFLRERISARPGAIVDETGKILGTHEGARFYTVGQRHGLKIAGGPYYVAKTDIASNVVIATRDEKNLLRDKAVLCNMNWLCAKTDFAQNLTARIRYRGPKVPVSVEIRNGGEDGGELSVTFAEPQRAVTPGQFAVLYDNDRVLCAGVIEK